jgi:hypothetical protein
MRRPNRGCYALVFDVFRTLVDWAFRYRPGASREQVSADPEELADTWPEREAHLVAARLLVKTRTPTCPSVQPVATES